MVLSKKPEPTKSAKASATPMAAASAKEVDAEGRNTLSWGEPRKSKYSDGIRFHWTSDHTIY